RSQFVFRDGEVNWAGRRSLKGSLGLVVALLEAGGFTARATGEVLVQRQDGTFEDGSAVRRFRFPRTGPAPGGLAELETVLRSGDVVTASLGRYVTLAGEVVHPGRYTLEGETTLSAILSSAGGFTRLASRRVKVSRRAPTGGQ